MPSKTKPKLILAYQQDLGSFRGTNIIVHYTDEDDSEQIEYCRSIREAFKFLEDWDEADNWIEVIASNDMANLRFYIGRDENHYFQASIAPEIVAKHISKIVKDQGERSNLNWEIHSSIGNLSTENLKRVRRSIKRIIRR